MIRTSHSISCLPSESDPQDQVLMFITNIFRSSFSKIMSITQKSKPSVTATKSPQESPCIARCPSDSTISVSSGSFVSPEIEELVSESLERGLPIIPFAHPTFDTLQEETKCNQRKNSRTYLNLSFSENTVNNNNIDEAEEEISESLTNEKEEIMGKVVEKSKVAISVEAIPRKKLFTNSCNDQSSYVEMSPCNTNHASYNQSHLNNGGEEPYMDMNVVCKNKKLLKNGNEETTSNCEKRFSFGKTEPSYRSNFPKYQSSRSWDLLSKSEGTMSVDRRVSRLHKKGNKHKDDYVFIDLERDNYMDMQQLGDKKWKFLTLNFGRKS